MSRADLKDLEWYISEFNEADIQDAVREVLEKYSHIPAKSVLNHIISIRERAWEVFPYPCIGVWRFAQFSIQKFPIYPQILQRVKNGEKLLDLGCALGQELRKLAHDGAPSENLYGCDLRMDFIRIGFDFFADQEMFHGHFIAADVFEETSELDGLKGQMSIIFLGAFLHLFDWDKQLIIAKRVVSLLDPKKHNVVFGRMVGNVVGREYPNYSSHADYPEHTRYLHNPKTLQEMWDEVGNATGTKWVVQADLTHVNDGQEAVPSLINPAGSGMIDFTIERVVAEHDNT